MNYSIKWLAKYMWDSNKIYRQKSALQTNSYTTCLKTSIGKIILIHKTAHSTIDSSNFRQFLQISKPESDSPKIEFSAIGLGISTRKSPVLYSHSPFFYMLNISSFFNCPLQDLFIAPSTAVSIVVIQQEPIASWVVK